MIRSLTVRNFQVHKKLALDLDQHGDVLVGSNDVGKSSLIRALRWLAVNQPGGDRDVRHGAKVRSVSVRIGKHTVKRRKGKGVNEYVLDGTKLTAFGSGAVPDEVQKVLRLDELNFQGQHDAAFWFSLTPGQVAKELNAVVNLDAIDRVLANVAAASRRAKAEAEVAEGRLAEAKRKAEELTDVPTMAADFQHLTGLEEGIAVKASRIAAIALQAKNARELLSSRQNAASACLDAANACRKGGKATTLAARQDGLLELLIQARRLGERRDPPDIAMLSELRDRVVGLLERAGWVQQLLTKIQDGERSCERKNKTLRMADSELERRTGKRCPLCQTPLSKIPATKS